MTKTMIIICFINLSNDKIPCLKIEVKGLKKKMLKNGSVLGTKILCKTPYLEQKFEFKNALSCERIPYLEQKTPYLEQKFEFKTPLSYLNHLNFFLKRYKYPLRKNARKMLITFSNALSPAGCPWNSAPASLTVASHALSRVG